jgi:threonyl-tRNA synthetase
MSISHNSQNLQLDIKRHSFAHLMACSVQIYFKELEMTEKSKNQKLGISTNNSSTNSQVQFGVGPVIDNGCYYDFILPRTLIPEDLPLIEAKIKEMLKQPLVFKVQEMELEQAIALFQKMNQPLKVELLNDLAIRGTTSMSEEERADFGEDLKITIYRLENEKTGEDLFVDLCKGPHVGSVKEFNLIKEEVKIKTESGLNKLGKAVEAVSSLSGFYPGVLAAEILKNTPSKTTTHNKTSNLGFKLDKFSGSYWRGDQDRNIQMQRIYALVFDTKEELKDFEEKRKLAQERDHKKIGAQAEWFYFDETAPGMPYFLPKGLIIKNKLIEFWRQDHLKRGYQEYSSPLISKQTLFETSGHWEHYRDDMMITKSKGEDIEWGIKAMSCPNACNVYAFKSRSYKELPLRFSDLDTLHRNENPGSLNGLFRVRCFNQDDSHNFIRPDQVEFEINNIIQIIYDFYKLFNLENDIKLYLSTMPDDHLGEEEDWRKAENIIEGLLKKSDFDYGIKDKDGAFYGPKIDIHLTDALGRDWQCGTVQLDYQLPTRFNLWYTDENGEKQRPVIIHRVIYGSLDRFLGILIEHTGGHLPFWLAPTQVKILTINNEPETMDYVAKIRAILDETVLMKPLKYNEIRYEVDDRNESLGKKIREATKAKIPVQLIVGPKDIEAGEVSVRTQEGEEKVKLEGLKEFLQQIK